MRSMKFLGANIFKKRERARKVPSLSSENKRKPRSSSYVDDRGFLSSS
nr:MAG TPA: hypothetical protein [Caudoviricetes sp.]